MFSKRSLVRYALLAGSLTSAAWSAAINTTALLPVTAQGSSFLELFGDGDAIFKVTNNTAVPLILDYALAIIVRTGGDADDLIAFTGVTADTQIAKNGGVGTYDYRVDNPDGDPFEPEDGGKDNVFFWAEFSDATNFGPNPTPVINVNGPGTFVFAGPVGPGAPGPDAVVLAALRACFTNPNPTVANCAPTMALYPNSFSPTPFPAVATVTVTDLGAVPEPSTFFMITLGLVGLFGIVSRAKSSSE